MLYHFAASIHRRPPDAKVKGPIQLSRGSFRPLQIASNELDLPLPISFEEAYQQLEHFERLFIEPDGSFVHGGAQDSARWQLDGHLYDRGRKLLYMELKGSCPEAALDRLLSVLSWPATELVFQLIDAGVVLDELEFRRWAKTKPSA